MTLKEMLNVLDYKTRICICSDMGAFNDPCTVEDLPYRCVAGALDAKIDRVYYDESDNTVTIEVVDYFSEDDDDSK